eukprot:3720225-Prymnesium_polylepis.1
MSRSKKKRSPPTDGPLARPTIRAVSVLRAVLVVVAAVCFVVGADLAEWWPGGQEAQQAPEGAHAPTREQRASQKVKAAEATLKASQLKMAQMDQPSPGRVVDLQKMDLAYGALGMSLILETDKLRMMLLNTTVIGAEFKPTWA